MRIFDSMIGLVMSSVEGDIYDDQMTFTSVDGRKFVFEHRQDCCESVSIEDITGDISDLIGSPILVAEEVDNMDEPECDSESYTWTFYRFETAKGSVTVRWLGVSNGYYAEDVSFREC